MNVDIKLLQAASNIAGKEGTSHGTRGHLKIFSYLLDNMTGMSSQISFGVRKNESVVKRIFKSNTLYYRKKMFITTAIAFNIPNDNLGGSGFTGVGTTDIF